jgi:hypothetical protein
MSWWPLRTGAPRWLTRGNLSKLAALRTMDMNEARSGMGMQV